MKRLFSLMLMFVVFGMLLMGCSNSPKTAAKKWMQAIENGNLEDANKYSTARTHTLNGLIVSMGAGSGDEDIEKTLKAIDDARVEIDGDSAKIYTSDDDKKPITLKKVDGDWKVDVEKN